MNSKHRSAYPDEKQVTDFEFSYWLEAELKQNNQSQPNNTIDLNTTISDQN